jgi:hypothetical protein
MMPLYRNVLMSAKSIQNRNVNSVLSHTGLELMQESREGQVLRKKDSTCTRAVISHDFTLVYTQLEMGKAI